jgi:rhodanese-related sulfurtransferase
MFRKAMAQVYLLLGLLVLLAASACGGGPGPVVTSTATPVLLGQPKVDMQPFLRDFLAGLPADWYLTTSQDVVRTQPFVVDIRQPEEYSRGFIEGAVNIPLRELVSSLQALPSVDKEIALVCDTGHRAAVGMMILQMLGYKKARTLDGGLQAWQAAKLTLVTAPVPPRPANPVPQVNSQLRAMLDYYLVHTLPYDWGTIDQAGLTTDQMLKPSSAGEAMPETYDQGPSLLVDVDTSEEFAQVTLHRVINLPLRKLPDSMDSMPLQETIDWA